MHLRPARAVGARAGSSGRRPGDDFTPPNRETRETAHCVPLFGFRRGGLVGLAFAAALVAGSAFPGTTPVSAAATGCSAPVGYPGDSAETVAISRWMAHGARARAVPGELPVMAALVESGLRNLQHGDTDTVGYFQMRVSIWNAGEYAGFPDNPQLQLEWFLDQATMVRNAALTEGDGEFGRDPGAWGEWAADVIRPAEQYRHLYQLELQEARELVGPACAGPPDVPRRLTIGHAGRRFEGRLRPAGACATQQRVSVYRKRKGRDERVGVDNTNSNGRYSAPARNRRPGRYYSRVHAGFEPTAGNCLADRSPTVRVG